VAASFCALAASLLLLSCAKETKTLAPHGNYPPEITAMGVNPPIVHAYETVYVQCTARDKNSDPLTYRWSATAGGFPQGNLQPSVAWRSPAGFRPDTLHVTVNDGKESVGRDTVLTITRIAAPGEIRYVNGSNLIDLRWRATPDSTLGGFAGYEIYSATRSLEGMPEESLAAHALTPSPLMRLDYRDLTARIGVKRYYRIRARRDYLGVIERSDAGPEIDTAARLDGLSQSSLYEVASVHGAYGVQIKTGRQFPIDPAYRDSIDVYLGTTASNDVGGNLLLKSPSLLAYRDPSWSARVTQIQRRGEDWSVATPAPEDSAAWGDYAAAATGSVYALRTADGHYAKFQIVDSHASPPERRIEFHWAWQPIPDYPRF
jgi:hypothetical protein